MDFWVLLWAVVVSTAWTAVTYYVGFQRGRLRVYRQLEEVTVEFMAEWLGEEKDSVSGELILKGDENGFQVIDKKKDELQ